MAISEGDEDYTTWTWFLEKLKIACPNLETDYSGNLESNHNKFVFVGNIKNGVQEALTALFPSNHFTCCAQSLERAVEEKYNMFGASEITDIASTFLCGEVDRLMYKIKTVNQDALQYLNSIDPKEWVSAEWLQDEDTLPRRYGIVSTFGHNTDEGTTDKTT